MPINSVQPLAIPSFVMPRTEKVEVRDGIRNRFFTDAVESLPDPNDFTLDSLLKAGVDLKEVSSVVIPKSSDTIPFETDEDKKDGE